MYRCLSFKHDPLPHPRSKLAQDLAKQLYDEFLWRKDSRYQLESEIWPACDDAFFCRRELPKNKGMRWADKSAFGDTDIRDGVLFLSDAISLALINPEENFLQIYSFLSQDQSKRDAMRDYQLYLHRKADTRSNYSVHVMQVLVRGIGAVGWEWRSVKRVRRPTPSEAIELALKEGYDIPEPEEQLDLEDPEQAMRALNAAETLAALQSQRIPYSIFDGPVIYPLDIYDVYPDPAVRLGSDPDIPVCVVTYRTKEELTATIDHESNKKLYSNLKDLKEYDMTALQALNPNKYRGLEIMGVTPFGNSRGGNSYIPVYTFHRMHQKCGNHQWVDTFFEVALTNDGPTLIRSYENPSDMGAPPLFFDSYADFISNTPYQTGAVEKALSAWQSKNVLSALTLQSNLVQTFPPVSVVADMLLDNSKFDAAPGGVTLIKGKQGIDFVAPLPVAQGGMDGMRAQQFQGNKISQSMGVYGAMLDSPDRSITRSKTATQINTESSSRSIGRDNILQKFIVRSLEPLCQAVLWASIQYNTEGIVRFERVVGEDILPGQLNLADLKQDWRVVVLGSRAQFNRNQEMEHLQQAYQYVTTSKTIEQDPQQWALSSELLFSILGRLGVKDLDKYRKDPAELLMEHPAIQQMIFQMAMEAYQQGAGGGPPPVDPKQAQQQPGAPQEAPPAMAPEVGQEAPVDESGY